MAVLNWFLKTRNAAGGNILNPEECKDNLQVDINGNFSANVFTAVTGYIPVSPNTTYYGYSPTGLFVYTSAAFFDSNMIPTGTGFSITGLGSITTDAEAHFMVLTITSPTGALPGPNFNTLAITPTNPATYSAYFDRVAVNPKYGNDLSYSLDRADGEEFYREQVSGKLQFLKNDYDLINNAVDSEKFILEAVPVTTPVPTSIPKWSFEFYKIDCDFNEDDGIIEVNPEASDKYVRLLSSIDKEYNLFELKPPTVSVRYKEPPVRQVYCGGDRFLTNYYETSYDKQELAIDPPAHADLVSSYVFGFVKTVFVVSSDYASGLSTDVTGVYTTTVFGGAAIHSSGLYGFIGNFHPIYGYTWRVYSVASGDLMYSSDSNATELPPLKGQELKGSNGVTGDTGNFYAAKFDIYARDIMNADREPSTAALTTPLPSQDIVANSTNRSRAIAKPGDVYQVSEEVQNGANEFGRVTQTGHINEGKYFKKLDLTLPLTDVTPVGDWYSASLWTYRDSTDVPNSYLNGEDFTSDSVYTLDGVIQALLTAMGTGISFAADTFHSEFLYSASLPSVFGAQKFLHQDPLIADTISVVTTQQLRYRLDFKYNYMRGATTSTKVQTVSLRSILTMLENTLGLKFHVADGRLRLEHLTWYDRGGTYGADVTGMDLTQEVHPRNFKRWDFSTKKYTFDKGNIISRLEFGYMDGPRKPFDGYAFDMDPRFEDIGGKVVKNLDEFNPDLDYIQGQNGEVSPSGMVVLGTIFVPGFGDEVVPYVYLNTPDVTDFAVQNGFFSWWYLGRFQIYNLPGERVYVDGVPQFFLVGTSRARYKSQTVKYPLVEALDPYKLVVTSLGNGKISKLSVNLSTEILTTTLLHDTE